MGYGDNDDTFSTCSLDSMADYFEEGNALECLATGWDSTIVSNIAVGDGCVHVELNQTDFDGVWNAVDGGYNGQQAYHINNNGNDRYLFYEPFFWSTGSVDLKWAMSHEIGFLPPYYFCVNEDLLSCNGSWSYITDFSTGTFSTIISSTIDHQCVNQGEADLSCASYDCLYVMGTGDFDGYFSAS